jgi:hypothetical protein
MTNSANGAAPRIVDINRRARHPRVMLAFFVPQKRVTQQQGQRQGKVMAPRRPPRD